MVIELKKLYIKYIVVPSLKFIMKSLQNYVETNSMKRDSERDDVMIVDSLSKISTINNILRDIASANFKGIKRNQEITN